MARSTPFHINWGRTHFILHLTLLGEFVFLAVVRDVFTRAIRCWNLSRWLDVGLTLDALKQGLVDHFPEIHHSDQVIQYAAGDYVQQVQSRHVQINMAARGEP